MIRVLKLEADPSLILALIGADFVPTPAGTADIPESDSANVSETEEVRKVEPGEEVEQQPQVASEGARTLGLEQPLPIAEKDGGSLVESAGRIDVDSAAQEPKGHVAADVERSADTTVSPIKEVEQQLPIAEESTEETIIQRDEVMEIARQITKEVEPSPTTGVPEETNFESIPTETVVTTGPTEEAEQPFLTPEEVMANLAARNSEDAEAYMEVVENRIVEWRPTEREEVTTDEAPGDREEVLVTDERKETKQAPPRDEDARARAATVHIYKRRPAREETSGKKSTKEQPRETPSQRTEGGVDSLERSAMMPPRRRRRLLIVEEPEEEEDVIFTPLDALPSSGPLVPPAEVDDSDRERHERKRKGKAIATPVKKKLR